MQQLKIGIVIKQSTYLELTEPIDKVVMNVEELTHSQQQPQVPNTHKKKPTIRQAIRTFFCTLQRSLPYRFLVLDEVKCKQTHSAINKLKRNLRLLI